MDRSGENGISDDLLSTVGSREHGLVTWEYKIVARTCCAQWEDVGPFQIDHWQYVFGNERPRPNANCDAGIDVSPAVRDYLGMSGMDVCDWKFVSVYEVPGGPWRLYGDNDTITHLRRQTALEIPEK